MKEARNNDLIKEVGEEIKKKGGGWFEENANGVYILLQIGVSIDLARQLYNI